MNAETLIAARNKLSKLQKRLGRELARGKYKDTVAIKQLRREIKTMKLEIGDITRKMITGIA